MLLRKIPRFVPSLTMRECLSILAALFSGRLAAGKEVERFESQFADYTGVKHALTVPSGRMGLYLILKNMGFLRGTEIILPAFTYHSIPSIILSLGLKPVFVDIDPETYEFDRASVEEHITPNTRAIIPTHLYGLPCDMDPIRELAARHNLKVIEDCAQAAGAEYQGQKVGSLGDAAYFTFGVTKNITTLGGGMVTTNDDGLAAKIREEIAGYKLWSRKNLFKTVVQAFLMKVLTTPVVFSLFLFPIIRLFTLLGQDIVHDIFIEKPGLLINSSLERLKVRPIDLQARVGLMQLRHLNERNGQRAENGRFLIEQLQGIPSLMLPNIPEKRGHIFISFAVQAEQRDALARKLHYMGIDTSKGYMNACSRLKLFKPVCRAGSGTGREVGAECPNALKVENEILHLPIYPNLSKRDFSHIAESIRKALR